MNIAFGTRLGRYEIRSKIGEGGMGEVYRARDEKLNRDVAIKVLPVSFSQDADRLRRFEQEAQATGTLNHPNILAVYDVGTHEQAPYIVAELLEGQELSDLLSQGPLPNRQAIELAEQIAHGLAAAHEKGIVHRDLKPANIIITRDGRAKILDFGLAKLRPSRDEVASSEIDTRKQITDPGTVMGTVGYMSPEQVRGQPADHRSDIFSFGSILYQMLTGQTAFRRETMAETMTAILKEEPPELSETSAKINLALEKIVRRCLEKQPARRFQTASDLAFALESLSGSSQSFGWTPAATVTVAATAKTSPRLPWLIAIVLAVALLATISAAWYQRRGPTQTFSARFTIAIPDDAFPVVDVEEQNLAVSPDGQYVAFVGYQQGRRMIWLRPLGALTAQTLANTEGAFSPFWSPDSRFLAFFADGKLKRTEVSGKSLQTVCELPEPRGDDTGSWGSAGTVVFSQEENGKIYRVTATGGTPSLVIDGKRGFARRWIRFLTDGRRFIFYKYDEDNSNSGGIYAGSIDSSEIKLVLATPPGSAQFVNGYLLYPREGSLMALALDERTLRPSGEPAVVVDHLPYFDKSGWCAFSASDTGVLAYMIEEPTKRLVWLDRAGRESGQIGEPGAIYEVRLAPDGQRAVISLADPKSSSGGDLWIQDIARGTRTRFVSGPTDDGQPVWSPDGRRIAYFSCCEDASALHIKDTNDTGKGEMPIKDQSFISPADWSQDGKFLLYRSEQHLWVLPMTGEAKPYALIATQSNWGSFSPDGQWVAFVSNETGREEVYVTSFGHPGEKWRVSTDGGVNPRWRHDGRELFYLSADNHLMSVEIKPGPAFAAGVPVALFKTDPLTSDFDPARDGQRFATIVNAPGSQRLPFALILDWTKDLKR